MKILLDLSFLGTAYCGYQVQPNAPTVQQQLNFAAKSLFGYDCDIIGCSRTDSGVHANHFFATVSEKGKKALQTDIAVEKIPKALNFYLPNDISVNSAKIVDDEFHPRYDVKYKEYLYCIWNSQTRNPFLHDRCWHYTKHIDDIAFENMRVAAEKFKGTHDFSSYMAANSTVNSTVRTIYDATVERNGDAIYFRVSADGFLYNMVRILTGTLISVAEGKITYDDIDDITSACDRGRAGMTAPPQGLYLNKVVY
ncbi:MAG: tRNA pseudouridine(38-40) synthase TruA [Clostridia bacterium]|nr:tRNA pseudouridine(38-40) synthase TruA [Clostridia bacterium]